MPGLTPTLTNRLPLPMECDAPFLEVSGELPKDLNGTLYRNGPNPQFASDTTPFFVGDGMLHAFHLENGRASYRNRWIRTPKWVAEHEAGRPLFSGLNIRRDDAPSTTPTDTVVANTSIVLHAGRLLALEEAHSPMEIEPGSLATRGHWTYGGVVNGPFTAHPKIDPETGEMIFFGYDAAGPLTPRLSYGIVNAAGAVTDLRYFDAPYPSIVHDFIVTRDHVLFPILPLTGSLDRAMRGEPPYLWQPERGAHVGLLKRNGPASEPIWFNGDGCYIFHVMNAWDDGGRLVADVMQYAEPPGFAHVGGRPIDPAKTRARLCRWTFDLSGTTDRFSQHYLDDISGEYPRIDERRAGLRNQHGWYACTDPEFSSGDIFSGIVHVDTATRLRNRYLLPPGDTISEPVFVPRAFDAPEGDGWLLAVAWRIGENRSDLLVFNATEIERGPIATVKLAHRVPDGFHGSWVGAS